MAVELWSLRPGPDGLVRITRRELGEGTAERIVVASGAEELVLERWREEHERVLGYRPTW